MLNQKTLASFHASYMNIYEPLGYDEKDFNRFISKIEDAKSSRPFELKQRDQSQTDWYLSHEVVGMSLYVDLFANNISGLIARIPYLTNLGITLIHLMPILKPRKGNNDGGYAVENYRDIDSRLGTLEDFKRLVKSLHEVQIKVVVDFVVNHTAKEHLWAQKASKGDSYYQKMYMMYDTNDIPKQFNETVPEVLPNEYPGNFTYYDDFKKYVFTSFSEFQWDLNYKNPVVLEEIIDIFLFLANLGIDVIRLDAIPFIWKELGTHCRNLPTVHEFMHLFYLTRDYVCPSVAILGEAIVEPDEIVKYFGTDEKPECQLLYHANLMVNLWNALATRDTRLLTIDNQRFVIPKHGTWMNYVRCHDDIGWGFNESAAQALGFNPFDHKQFLISFYNGSFEGSFARGQNYQCNDKNKDARTNGTLASLAGLELSLEKHDSTLIDLSIKRIHLLNAYMISMPGIPLIYSGDEVGQLNHYTKTEEYSKKDGRWIHRLSFPWERKHEWSDFTTPSGQIFNHLKKLIHIRKHEPLFHQKAIHHILESYNKHIYMGIRSNNQEDLLLLFNFSENRQDVHFKTLKSFYLHDLYEDIVTHQSYDLKNDDIHLKPYEYLWLKKLKR